MTMIAATLNYELPFIVADILFSSKEGDKDIQLPTNNFPIMPHLPKDLSDKPIFLKQKLYILAPNVCVAVAGLYGELAPFIEEFRKQCKYYSHFGEKKISKEDIQDFLQQYKLDINLFESGFLIHHVGYDERNNPITFNQFMRGNWESVESEMFEQAFAFGSGQKQFFNHIEQPIKITSSHENGNIHRALQMNATFISKLLTIERFTLNNLKNAWGAGYEIAFFTGSTFQKFDNIAYIINHGDFDDTGDIGVPVPRLILHYKYINDILFITAVELYKITRFDKDDQIIFQSQTEDFAVNVFVVPSIEQKEIDLPIEVPEDFSFSTLTVSFGYGLITPSNGIYNPAFYTVSKDVSVNFFQDKFVEVRLHSDLNDMVRVSAKDAYPNILKEAT